MNLEKHLHRLYYQINPELRAAYYSKYIDKQAIDLSTAENVLLFDFYQQNIFDFKQRDKIDTRDTRYAVEFGSDAYRESIADLLTELWGLDTLQSKNIFAVSGVSAALECLAFALFKKGDGAILPAPLWYGFPWSLCDRPGMNFYPFQTEKQDGRFDLCLDDVRKAFNSIEPKPRLLILTNPNNPLGVNYAKELLEDIYHWVLYSTDMHIVSDEIYGFSQIRPADTSSRFHSAFTLDSYKNAPEEMQRRVHMVWGLAKDFGLSGFKVGFIFSKSSRVMQCMQGTNQKRSMSWFSPFNSLNQYMLQPLFLDKRGQADPTLAMDAMNRYAGRQADGLLAGQYAVTKQHLDQGGIKYLPDPNAAIFFWLDLREYLHRELKCKQEDKVKLHPNIDPAEYRLANAICENAKLLLIPGMECYNHAPGYFRLCYTAQEAKNVATGIDRLADYLHSIK